MPALTSMGPVYDSEYLKLRHDRINMQKVAVDHDVDVTQQSNDFDSNKLYYDASEPTDYPKRQRDIENKSLQKCIPSEIVDLEQCLDCSLSFIQSVPSVILPQTSVKSTLCVTMETSVKMNVDAAAETSTNSSKRSDSFREVVDLSQVEPALEKGSQEATDSEKETVIDVQDGDPLPLDSVSGKLDVGDKYIPVPIQESPSPVITLDAVCHHTHSHTNKQKIFDPFPQEAVSEHPTSFDAELSSLRAASQVDKNDEKCQFHQNTDVDGKVQTFCHCVWHIKEADEHSTLESKHRPHCKWFWLWNALELWISGYGRRCPTGGASNSAGRCKSGPSGSCGGSGSASANQGCGFTSMPSSSRRGGHGHGGDDRDPWRHWQFTGNASQRYVDEKKKQKAKRPLEEGVLAWLLQNEFTMEAIDDNWRLLLKDCTAVCLLQACHENCSICDALMLQLKHCATASCDVNTCSVCHRVVILISMHYAECRRFQQHCCCNLYLTASPNLVSAFLPDVMMVSICAVRTFLLSVFQTLSNQDAAAAAAADDDDDDGDDKDFDSDSSDDSIMMPSFQLPSNKTPRSAVPHGGAISITDDLPGFSGRGINSATTGSVANDTQPTRRMSQRLETAMAAEMSDPRLCISSECRAGAVGLHNEAIHSVPVRPRGKMRYGSKSVLRKFASLWQNYADRARQDGLCRLHELPVGGVILDEFRDVMVLKSYHYEEYEEWMEGSYGLGTDGLIGAGSCGKCVAGIDLTTKKRFCIKIINIHNFDSKELKVWSCLEHPDIVQLYGAMIYRDSVYIFQELITGSTLKEYIRRSPCCAVDAYTALILMQNLLRVLKYLQLKNVIHNDIKGYCYQ